jgi:hypothetical protein
MKSAEKVRIFFFVWSLNILISAGIAGYRFGSLSTILFKFNFFSFPRTDRAGRITGKKIEEQEKQGKRKRKIPSGSEFFSFSGNGMTVAIPIFIGIVCDCMN